jgi:Ca2+-binding EF-hand superfamily protein
MNQEKNQIDINSLLSQTRLSHLINKQCLELYISDLYREICVKEGTSNHLTDYCLFKYTSMPLILIQRIINSMKSGKDLFSFDQLLDFFEVIYLGSFNNLCRFIFKLLDTNNDGSICYNDCKILLLNMALNNDKLISEDKILKSIEVILRSYFKTQYLNYSDFINCVENKNSDLFIILYIYMIINIPITEQIIDYFNTDKRITSFSEIGKDNDKIIICKYTNLIEIFIGSDNYKNLSSLKVDMEYFDEDEFELLELEKDDNVSDLYNFQNFAIKRNPHLYASLRPANTSPIVKPTKIKKDFTVQVNYI